LEPTARFLTRLTASWLPRNLDQLQPQSLYQGWASHSHSCHCKNLSEPFIR